MYKMSDQRSRDTSSASLPSNPTFTCGARPRLWHGWHRLISPPRSSESAPLELLLVGRRASASGLSPLPTDSPAGCNLSCCIWAKFKRAHTSRSLHWTRIYWRVWARLVFTRYLYQVAVYWNSIPLSKHADFIWWEQLALPLQHQCHNSPCLSYGRTRLRLFWMKMHKPA